MKKRATLDLSKGVDLRSQEMGVPAAVRRLPFWPEPGGGWRSHPGFMPISVPVSPSDEIIYSDIGGLLVKRAPNGPITVHNLRTGQLAQTPSNTGAILPGVGLYRGRFDSAIPGLTLDQSLGVNLAPLSVINGSLEEGQYVIWALTFLRSPFGLYLLWYASAITTLTGTGNGLKIQLSGAPNSIEGRIVRLYVQRGAPGKALSNMAFLAELSEKAEFDYTSNLQEGEAVRIAIPKGSGLTGAYFNSRFFYLSDGYSVLGASRKGVESGGGGGGIQPIPPGPIFLSSRTDGTGYDFYPATENATPIPFRPLAQWDAAVIVPDYGLVVAVRHDGKLYFYGCPDGLDALYNNPGRHWERLFEVDTPAILQAAAFGGSEITFVGNGAIITADASSPESLRNPQKWTVFTDIPGNFVDVAYGNGTWGVLDGSRKLLLRSGGPTEWQVYAPPSSLEPNFVYWDSLAYWQGAWRIYARDNTPINWWARLFSFFGGNAWEARQVMVENKKDIVWRRSGTLFSDGDKLYIITGTKEGLYYDADYGLVPTFLGEQDIVGYIKPESTWKAAIWKIVSYSSDWISTYWGRPFWFKYGNRIGAAFVGADGIRYIDNFIRVNTPRGHPGGAVAVIPGSPPAVARPNGSAPYMDRLILPTGISSNLVFLNVVQGSQSAFYKESGNNYSLLGKDLRLAATGFYNRPVDEAFGNENGLGWLTGPPRYIVWGPNPQSTTETQLGDPPTVYPLFTASDGAGRTAVAYGPWLLIISSGQVNKLTLSSPITGLAAAGGAFYYSLESGGIYKEDGTQVVSGTDLYGLAPCDNTHIYAVKEDGTVLKVELPAGTTAPFGNLGAFAPAVHQLWGDANALYAALGSGGAKMVTASGTVNVANAPTLGIIADKPSGGGGGGGDEGSGYGFSVESVKLPPNTVVWTEPGYLNVIFPYNYATIVPRASSGVNALASHPSGVIALCQNEVYVLTGRFSSISDTRIAPYPATVGLDDGARWTVVGDTLFVIWKGRVWALTGGTVQPISLQVEDGVPFEAVAYDPIHSHLLARKEDGRVYRYSLVNQSWSNDMDDAVDLLQGTTGPLYVRANNIYRLAGWDEQGEGYIRPVQEIWLEAVKVSPETIKRFRAVYLDVKAEGPINATVRLWTEDDVLAAEQPMFPTLASNAFGLARYYARFAPVVSYALARLSISFGGYRFSMPPFLQIDYEARERKA